MEPPDPDVGGGNTDVPILGGDRRINDVNFASDPEWLAKFNRQGDGVNKDSKF